MILVMAGFEFSPAMNVVLLLAVLCVTSSTIDSIAVALHEVRGRRTGTAVALGICLFWGIFVEVGVLDLWSYAGVYRVAFALAVLGMAWRISKRKKKQWIFADGITRKRTKKSWGKVSGSSVSAGLPATWSVDWSASMMASGLKNATV